jgi:kumamolisin
MKARTLLWLFPALVIAGTSLLYAQKRPDLGPPNEAVSILTPASSVEGPDDVRQRAHTNHVVVLRSAQQFSLPSGETPASIRAVYNLLPYGGGGTIAIVDAFDYPTAENDLNVFSTQFGLPACTTANGCFRRVYAKGVKPRANCGWAQEAALDIEWAHAMAPNAKIVLVEAASNSFSDLFQAVDKASQTVAQGGGRGQVSMSWGGSEFSSETAYDSHFTTNNVVYFAASGDTGGQTIFPGVSPNVVSAGGTRINRDGSGHFVSETGWSGSGGGPSKYEARPAYQFGISALGGNKRGTPDFSFDADPASGVSVYDSTSCQGMTGWMVFGGTSVASPSLAGIVNLAGSVSSGSQTELSLIYTSRGNPADFRDITSGSAGSYSAQPGWDFVTGVGSDQGTSGK